MYVSIVRLINFVVVSATFLTTAGLSGQVIFKKVFQTGESLESKDETGQAVTESFRIGTGSIGFETLIGWSGGDLGVLLGRDGVFNTNGVAGVWNGSEFKVVGAADWPFPGFSHSRPNRNDEAPVDPVLESLVTRGFVSGGRVFFSGNVDDKDTAASEGGRWQILGFADSSGLSVFLEKPVLSDSFLISRDGSSVLVNNFAGVDGDHGWVGASGEAAIWNRDSAAPGFEGLVLSPDIVPFLPLSDRTVMARGVVSEDGLFLNSQEVYYLIGPDGSKEFLFGSLDNPYDAVEGVVAGGTYGIGFKDTSRGKFQIDMNESKQIVFGAVIQPDEGSGANAIFYRSVGEAPALLATSGTPILDSEGQVTGTFESVNQRPVRIDAAGNVTFEATLLGTNDSTVWRYLAEEELFVRVGPAIGAPIPGFSDTEVREVRIRDMNASGRLVLGIAGVQFGNGGLFLQSMSGGFTPVIYGGQLLLSEEDPLESVVLTDLIISDTHALAMLMSSPGGDVIYTARLASDVVPVGEDYIWDGGAGTGDWHSVTDGRSNWVDAFGTPWPEPPGGSGNEEVYIGPDNTVELNADASISDLELDRSTLVVKSNLTFNALLNLKPEAQLRLHTGSIQSTLGALEAAGDIVKRPGGDFRLKPADLNLFDSLITVEEGSLIIESEFTRFQGASGNAKVLGGLLDLKSKEIILETNTVLDTGEQGAINVGSELPDAAFNFSGGTDVNKRRLTYKGRGVVEMRVPFTVGLMDEVYVENSSVQSNGGVIVNLPAGKVIEAEGNFFNFGTVTLQRGGLVGEVESTGLLIVEAANANDEISIGGTSISSGSRFELRSDANYVGQWVNGPGSTFRTFGATLSPTNATEDVLIFDKRSKVIAKEGINEIHFPTSESSHLSSPINIEESASLEISNSKMAEEVKIVVEAAEGSVSLDNTEFESLDISGPGEAILVNKLKGTKAGGISPDHVDAGADDLNILKDRRPPSFILKTQTFLFDSAELLGFSQLPEEGVIFNIGDFSQRTSANPKFLGIADGLTIGQGATFLIGSSAALTTQQPLSLVDADLYNLGVITLGHSLSSTGDSGLFKPLLAVGSKSHRGILRVPENVSEPVIISSDLLLSFGNNTVEVGNGSRLNVVVLGGSFASTFIEENTLPTGDWIIGDGASLLFPKDEPSGELLPINVIQGNLTIGTAPEGIPSINGFPNRSTDLDVGGGLKLKNTSLNFDVRSIDDEPVRGKLRVKPDAIFDLEDSTINGADLLVDPSLRASLAFNINGGTLNGSVDMNGVTGVGASPGEGLINGDFTMLEEGRINIEFAGTEAKTQYDQLEVTGTAALDGKLVLYFLDGYEPAGGEQFEFLKAPTITGNFAEIDQSRLGRDIRMDFAVGDTGLMATAMPLTIASYGDWRAAFFTEPDAVDDLVSGPGEDPDGDGWTNRMEYVFDGNPNVQDGSPVTFTLTETGTPEVYSVQAIFDWVASVTDVVWAFETSDDLQSWTEVAATESSQTPDGEYVTSVVDFDETVDASDRIFIRMSAKDVVP